MKLSQLTPEQKTRLLAELDGWTWVSIGGTYPYNRWVKGEYHVATDSLPPYLTSYDAIIPLVQKLEPMQKYAAGEIIKWNWDATPSQLCDAVLVATGKAEI